jgi:3-hydroxy acid dehydrogenase/malonic semialdehyde reductase
LYFSLFASKTIRMGSRLEKKWILITGASSGFGAAAAKAFAREGSCLLLGARRKERIEAVAAEGKKLGATAAHAHPLDVSKTASVEEFAKWVQGITPKVDVLINNAGGALGLEPIAQGKDEDWEGMFQSNVLGILKMTRAILPLMKDTKGTIINIGSVAGHGVYEGGAAYCAAKAAELQITRTLRLEVNGTGLRVSTVDPGLAETEFSVVRFKGDAQKASKVYEGINPLRAEDIGETLVWVASRPDHVCIDEVIIKPTDQAGFHKIYRRTAK